MIELDADELAELINAIREGEENPDIIERIKSSLYYPEAIKFIFEADKDTSTHVIMDMIYNYVPDVLPPKLTKKEITELVGRMISCEYNDPDFFRWYFDINRSVADPEWFSKLDRSHDGLSSEEIVEEIISYQPIILPYPLKDSSERE
ncbi:hypothetical protein [Paenibacillus methanolicus]|uniref:Uncharacterized protein n=1 Tax=Paenibacillus methanolicus TaxID=582686 RepID=A0A5S5C178_9BACL|nr:hypothetical protein [Paenibacillus methanolicus]TYP73054.1 hypothetical protein BCM02_10738 [Paenibacillus methanolicus]